MAWKTFTVGGGGGEINTAANVGSGTGLVFRNKSGPTINLRSIKAGANVTIVNDPDEILISASGGGGGGSNLLWADISNQTNGSTTIFNVPPYSPGSLFAARNGVIMKFSDVSEINPTQIQLAHVLQATEDLFVFFRAP